MSPATAMRTKPTTAGTVEGLERRQQAAAEPDGGMSRLHRRRLFLRLRQRRRPGVAIDDVRAGKFQRGRGLALEQELSALRRRVRPASTLPPAWL